MTIFKYPVQVTDTFALQIPAGARFLGLQNQHGNPQMWWHVDQSITTVTHTFHVVGTGIPMPEESQKWKYLGTFQMLGGTLVFHVFQE